MKESGNNAKENDWRMGEVEIELSSAKLGNVGNQPNFTQKVYRKKF